MTTALEQINIRRLLIHTQKQIAAAMKPFEGQPDTPATRAEMAAQMNQLYAQMGLSDTFSATVVDPVPHRIEQEIIETLPPETDGTIQMGDGDGPEIVTRTETIEVAPGPGTVEVSVQVKRPIENIQLDIQLP